MPPKFIIKGMHKPFQTQFRFETFRDAAAGMRGWMSCWPQGKVVGLQTSVFWLPYFPEDMRFHFNAHNLLVYGKEGDEYLISDPVAELPQRCASADLQRARFAKGALAPKGLLYYPEGIGRTTSHAGSGARKPSPRPRASCSAPSPSSACAACACWRTRSPSWTTAELSLNYVGHIVRMQEEIGTGGAGFRFLYAAFLQEAAQITGIAELDTLSERLNEVGDGWREFALRAARMIKGRESFDPKLLGEMLRGQAESETEFFRALKRAVA